MVPRYAPITDPDHETYEFLSSGSKGTIKKVIRYKEVRPGIYNLAFGDWDEHQKEVKDDVRSNNGDRGLVLATVAFTVTDFLEHHPDAQIYFEGSTAARTRLYQMGIVANWDQINQKYDLFGFIDDSWEPFRHRKNYKAFILRPR
jgi:hypothetical protein